MDKKKIYLIGLILLIITIIGIAFLIFKKDGRIEYGSYGKYSTNITIDTKRDKKFDSILIKVSDDGSSAKVDSTSVNKETFIIGKNLYYIDGNIIYTYEYNKSYRDIYSIISKFTKVDEENVKGEYTFYTSILSAKDLNELLDALHFKKKTSSSSLAKITVLNERIDEFNFIVSDIEGYEEVRVNLKFSELDSSFKVDTSRIFGSPSLGAFVPYKMVTTKDNPYEVIK